MNVPFYSLDYVNRTLGDALRESFSDVLDSKWFIRGSRCAAFEEAFAAYCGKKACVGVGNGLDALTLMLNCLQLHPVSKCTLTGKDMLSLNL